MGGTFFTHKGGTHIFTQTGGAKYFLHTWGNNDVGGEKEKDVSKANILARVLTVPEGPEILVNDNCHFMALYALC